MQVEHFFFFYEVSSLRELFSKILPEKIFFIMC